MFENGFDRKDAIFVIVALSVSRVQMKSSLASADLHATT